MTTKEFKKYLKTNPVHFDIIEKINCECKKLIITDSQGVYIPKIFVENFELKGDYDFSWAKKEILKGHDSENYWDAWNDVLDNYDDEGIILIQDGDLWFASPKLDSFLEIVKEELDFDDYLSISDEV